MKNVLLYRTTLEFGKYKSAVSFYGGKPFLKITVTLLSYIVEIIVH